MSGLINKVKDAVGGHKNAGNTSSDGKSQPDPHTSFAKNALEYDNTGTTGAGSHLSGSNNSGLTGQNTSGSTGSGITGSNTTAGPHSSNLGNEVDPRVDSDLGKLER